MLEISPRVRMLLEMERRPERVERVHDVNVEPGAVCNLRCPFCATPGEGLDLSRELLTPQRLKEILDRVGPAIRSVGFIHLGEPTLNPRIHEVIAEASRRGCHTMIHTNLAAPSFDAAQAARLVGSGLSVLVLSCDGASQRTYGQYRVGGRFETVMRNLRTLLEARRKSRSGKPHVVWKFLVHAGNAHEKELAGGLAGELGIPVAFERLDVPPSLKGLWPAGAPASPAEPSEDPVRPYPGCLEAWDRPIINPDGSVIPCCVLHSREFVLGNILEQPLPVVWNAPLVRAMRRYLSSGDAPRTRIPCLDCVHNPRG